MKVRTATLLLALIAIAVGCASSGPHGRPSDLPPGAVLQQDLPPPENPPIEIRSTVARDPRTGAYRYTYTVSNGTPYRITDFHIGLSRKNGANALGTPPLGLTENGRMPPNSYSAPEGWTLLYDGHAPSRGSLTWTAQDSGAILPGESRTGFRVTVAGKDEAYRTSQWFAIVTGEPGTYAGTLERSGDEIPPGDSVDRLGRLSVSPRISRGDVTIRFRTPKKAMPIVSVLDSKGEVIRKYPRAERSGSEHQIVWDRRDAAERVAPAGEYFIRVRYGFTERFGRVTLER